MRPGPLAILLWACCAPQLRAHQLEEHNKVLEIQCDVTTRIIGQITKLGYSFGTNTSTAAIGSHTKHSVPNGHSIPWKTGTKEPHNTKPGHPGTWGPSKGQKASTWTQVPSSVSKSNTETQPGGSWTTQSAVTSPSGTNSAPGTDSMSQSSESTSLTQMSTEGQTTPAQTVTMSLSTSSSSMTAPTASPVSPGCSGSPAPSGFQPFCGQVPGPNSVVLTALKRRAVANLGVCVDECVANHLCVGISFRDLDGLCTLYSAIVDFIEDPTFDTYIKVPVSSSSNSATMTQPMGSQTSSDDFCSSTTESVPSGSVSGSVSQPVSTEQSTSSSEGTMMSSKSESVAVSQVTTSSTASSSTSVVRITITRASSTTSSAGAPMATEVDLPDDQDTDLDIEDLYDEPDDVATDVETDPPVSFVSVNPNGKGLLVSAPANYSGSIAATVTITDLNGKGVVNGVVLKDRDLLTYLLTIILNIIPKNPVTTVAVTTVARTTTTTTKAATTTTRVASTTTQARTSQATTTVSIPTSVVRSQTSSVNVVGTTTSILPQTTSSVTSLIDTNPVSVPTSQVTLQVTTTATTTTAAPVATTPVCSFTGYDNGTNIGFYADAASTTYSGCNAVCNSNPSCQSFALSLNSPPACIIYSYPVVSDFAIYSAASNNTFYLRGGACAPLPVTPTTATTTTSATPTPSPNFPVCQNGKIPFSISSNTLASSFTDCGTLVTIDGLGTYENPNSVCQLDVSGQAYCNNCNSCANAKTCTADSDCPSNYACIVNSACTLSGNVGVAMCLYMLYDSSAPDLGCYPPY